MRVKAVLWDMDGVIIDSERFYWEEMDSFYEGIGVFLSPERKRSFIGSSAMINSANVKKWYPDLPQTAEELCAGHKAALLRGIMRVDGLIPGVGEWLSRLRAAGVKNAVATSSTGEMLDWATRALRLDEIFDTIVTAMDVPRAKPNPDIFLEAARRFGAEPADCLVMEDSQNGVLAAKAAGMRVAVFTGAPGLSGAPTPEGGDYIFDRYDDAAFDMLFK